MPGGEFGRKALLAADVLADDPEAAASVTASEQGRDERLGDDGDALPRGGLLQAGFEEFPRAVEDRIGRREFAHDGKRILCRFFWVSARGGVASRHTPILETLYQRLLANGKAKKLTLTVLMRKLITLANRPLKYPHFPFRIKTVADPYFSVAPWLISHGGLLPPLGHRFRVDGIALGQRLQALLTRLDRPTHRRRRAGAAV